MVYAQVLDAFIRLSGCGESEAKVQQPVLEAAIRALRGRLRHPADAHSDDPQLTEAAAAIAYYRYLLGLRASSFSGSVKLGDLSVSASGSDEAVLSAKAYMQETLAAIADKFVDTAFAVCEA